MSSVNIMIAALELFMVIGYIMYHIKLRKDGNVSQVVTLKAMNPGMTPAGPQSLPATP